MKKILFMNQSFKSYNSLESRASVVQVNHLPWIDTLRFVAAFMVLFSHSRNDFFVAYGELPLEMRGLSSMLFYTLGRLGHEAVIVFFVLSGFLVGGRGLERIFNGTFKMKDYTIDRTVRIGLPLITAIVLFFFTCLLVGEHFDWLIALGNLLSLQGICCPALVTPFWSLSYEVWFYVILAAFALAVQKKQIGLILLVVCCLAFCFLNIGYLLIWLIGAVAYLIKPKKSVWIKWGSLFGIGLFMMLLQLTTNSNSFKEVVFDLNRLVLEVGMSFFMALFIQQIILCKPIHGWAKALDNWGTHWAAFSYTLYLSHRIVFLPLYKFWFKKGQGIMNTKDISLYLLFLIITLISCYAIYYRKSIQLN